MPAAQRGGSLNASRSEEGPVEGEEQEQEEQEQEQEQEEQEEQEVVAVMELTRGPRQARVVGVWGATRRWRRAAVQGVDPCGEIGGGACAGDSPPTCHSASSPPRSTHPPTHPRPGTHALPSLGWLCPGFVRAGAGGWVGGEGWDVSGRCGVGQGTANSEEK